MDKNWVLEFDIFYLRGIFLSLTIFLFPIYLLTIWKNNLLFLIRVFEKINFN